MKRAQALICLTAVLALAGCSAAHDGAPSAGTVTGRLLLEGGPIGPNGQQPGIRPITGAVRFTGGDHHPVTVRTTSSGVFSVQLPAGRYQVSSRQVRSTPVWVTVTAHHTTSVTLTSIVPSGPLRNRAPSRGYGVPAGCRPAARHGPAGRAVRWRLIPCAW